jgi:hypothetical protein
MSTNPTDGQTVGAGGLGRLLVSDTLLVLTVLMSATLLVSRVIVLKEWELLAEPGANAAAGKRPPFPC